jgi:hypothetical protein
MLLRQLYTRFYVSSGQQLAIGSQLYNKALALKRLSTHFEHSLRKPSIAEDPLSNGKATQPAGIRRRSKWNESATVISVCCFAS